MTAGHSRQVIFGTVDVATKFSLISKYQQWKCVHGYMSVTLGSKIFFFYRPQRSWGKVIFFRSVCQEFCPGGGEGGIPACFTGGIQHALQVSRPTPKGGSLRGLARGVSRPTPGGSPGLHLGGVSRPTPGRISSPYRGRVCIPACTEADTTPSRQLLLRAVRILLECILAL